MISVSLFLEDPPWGKDSAGSIPTGSCRLICLLFLATNMHLLTGAFYVGNGWVAGGIRWLLLVMKWIIPENSLLSTSKKIGISPAKMGNSCNWMGFSWNFTRISWDLCRLLLLYIEVVMGLTKQHTVGNPPFGMDKTDKPSQLQVLCPDMHSHRTRDQHGWAQAVDLSVRLAICLLALVCI